MKTGFRPWVYSSLCYIFFIFISLLVAGHLVAQNPDPGKKMAPVLLQQILEGRLPGRNEFILTVTSSGIPSELYKQEYKAQKLFVAENFLFFRVWATASELQNNLLVLPGIIFVENGKRIPKEEIQVSSLDLAVNKINLAHRKFPAWNGDGVIASVKEDKPDTTDIDFKGRFLSTNLSSSNVSSHASIMATMIAGGGNSWYNGKGAAWGSTISSSSFATLLPDANAAYQQYNISVQNHSYGVGVENYYGADAAAYDASTISNPSLLHIFSSGNSGTASSSTGIYSGIAGFANQTGSFKMAKNIITVGATDSFSVVAMLSSKGPAHDGRVKPELVAYGEDGSSGAAALVSGAALMLQQGYKQMNGVLPPNTLVKAILINSADDIGNIAVDYSSGFGSMNTLNALKTLQAVRYFNGSVSNGGNQFFLISIPAGIKKVKCTLVWNDPPATPNASKALINDLDIELINTSTAEIWKPWVLNNFPHIDSLQKPAIRNRDSLNNIEQVSLENPAAGNYQIKITGYNIPAGSQNFRLAYQFDSTDVFEWQFPSSNDFIFPSSANVIRWKSSFGSNTGNIEYSIDNGNSWQLIQSGVNLSTGFYRWKVPALTSKALLKMSFGVNQFPSDTFTIANRIVMGVGFNCPDSFLIFWNKLPGVSSYNIYKLGNKYLEPIAQTTDTSLVLSKTSNPSLHYAVAPIISNKEGVKSYTYNYTMQGVECYIRAFLSLLVNNSAKLDLSLGTLYNINRIVLEKFDGTNFKELQQISNPATLLYSFTDALLKKGLNSYRVKLELSGGRTIYSSVETVYYFAGSEFIVYPNPAPQYQPLVILSDNQSGTPILQVINMQGQKVYQMPLNDISNQLPPGRLSKGLYLFRIIRTDMKDVILKVVVK